MDQSQAAARITRIFLRVMNLLNGLVMLMYLWMLWRGRPSRHRVRN